MNKYICFRVQHSQDDARNTIISVLNFNKKGQANYFFFIIVTIHKDT